VFLVPLPEKCMFSVPRNLKLVAVPLFDLYENSARFGPVIAAIPQLVGRFSFIYNSPADEDTDISQ
jgi:cleavage and polyadenylation specificity factor subunit 5